MIKFILFIILLIIILLIIITDRINDFNTLGQNIIIPLMNSNKWSPFIDKIKFKDKCKERNIETFKTLAIYDTVQDLINNLDNLPQSFIIKYNTESGMNLIIKDKNDWSKKQLKKQLSKFKPRLVNLISDETQYSFIKPKFLIEELISPVPQDYKIIVSNGKPVLLWIDSDRYGKHKRTVFRIRDDYSTIRLDDCYWNYPIDKNIELPPPNIINDMCNIAKSFTNEINLPFFRVDLYYVNNKIYGGEITLTSEGFTSKISKKCASYAIGIKNEISER